VVLADIRPRIIAAGVFYARETRSVEIRSARETPRAAPSQPPVKSLIKVAAGGGGRGGGSARRLLSAEALLAEEDSKLRSSRGFRRELREEMALLTRVGETRSSPPTEYDLAYVLQCRCTRTRIHARNDRVPLRLPEFLRAASVELSRSPGGGALSPPLPPPPPPETWPPISHDHGDGPVSSRESVPKAPSDTRRDAAAVIRDRQATTNEVSLPHCSRSFRRAPEIHAPLFRN